VKNCSMPIWILSLIALICATSSVYADTVMEPLDKRFAPDAAGKLTTDEVPDFQRHISPLLGRLGCNGRACHGSFQGQGGFMLSLFGYDFDADHQALLKDGTGRVDTKNFAESLILSKPTDADMHEGGKRFDKNGWEYQVFRRWIEDGANQRAATQSSDQKLVKLDVSPLEISFDTAGKKKALKAIAIWENGTREDVTSLCRFFSNDSAIASINEKGIITSGEQGDTHVVVAYDVAVVPVNVLRPIGPTGQLKSQIAKAESALDKHVLTKLDKLGVMPSDIASDADFFRRVSLDVAGTLPTAEQVKIFLSDKSPNKRERIIEDLLSSPGYAAAWATFFCDLTGNNDDQLRNFSPVRESPSVHWYQWLYERIDKNVPYDKIVEGIVTAVSREPGESYRDYCESMTKIAHDRTGKSFAERDDMMYYWARNNLKTAEERAIAFAYSFCGVRIQCAQCHKHPFDQWTKKDFDQFERLFDGIQANQNSMQPDAKDDYTKMIADLGINKSTKGNNLQKEIYEIFKKGNDKRVIPFPELVVRKPEVKKDKNNKAVVNAKKASTARLLGSEYVDLSTVNDPREPLMAWLRDKNNPYFAKAMVNRIWARYFQVGIVNPPDDLNLANAPSNEPLLNYLAQGFIENNYDLKWVHRTILNSDTYQRSWKTNSTNEMDRRNFSHALLRRLPAETAYDALQIALSSDRQATALCRLESERALTLGGASTKNNGKSGEISTYALSVFGRSIRETNCDCDRSADPSLLQTVFIRNDTDVLKAITDPKRSWLAQVAAERGWAMPRNIDPQNDMKQSNQAKDERELEELDRKVRTYSKQLEKMMEQKASESSMRDAKSRLALYEKRFAEKKEALAKSKADASSSNQANSLGELTEAQMDKVRKSELTTIIEEAFLRTLSRRPNADELKTSQQSVALASSPVQGLSDLLWALINSKEFILNH
jgi:Protein of unknown function (DUF1549)/Protein of unknown function (DUF1553)